MKKVISLISGLILPMTMLTSLSAGAVSTSSTEYDVNNDGVVNSSDVLFINKYLMGLQDVTDLTRLDVTDDFIVDKMDMQLVSTVVMGGSFEVNSTSTSLLSITSTTSRDYWKYVCDSGNDPTNPEEYTLTQSVVSNGVSASTSSLFPVLTAELSETENSIIDNRVQVTSSFENSIVKVVADDGCWGTGFIIDDNIILTAAHVLYDNLSNYMRETDVILFNENGVAENRISADEIHIPVLFDTNSFNGDFEYDYGLIYVENDLSGYPHFDLGTALNLIQESDGVELITMGFPQDKGNSESIHYWYKTTGVIKEIYLNKLYHRLYTVDGQSGSPMYQKKSYTMNGVNYTQTTAIAIVSHQYTPTENAGLHITAPVLQFCKQNNNIG